MYHLHCSFCILICVFHKGYTKCPHCKNSGTLHRERKDKTTKDNNVSDYFFWRSKYTVIWYKHRFSLNTTFIPIVKLHVSILYINHHVFLWEQYVNIRKPGLWDPLTVNYIILLLYNRICTFYLLHTVFKRSPTMINVQEQNMYLNYWNKIVFRLNLGRQLSK